MSNSSMILSGTGEVQRHTGWFIALGILFIIGGVLAIAMPLVASLAVAIVVGWSLIVLGIVQIVQAWSMRSWGGFAWQLIIGILFVLGGFDMAFFPLSGAITLALVLGVVFLVKGIIQLILGFRYRPHAGWGWMIAAGILAAVVGLMVLAQWPLSGAWVPGTLAGISLIFSGWSYVAVAMAVRRIAA
jgi:uncharacterized membrane protein HdeD (DUF308 family)